MGIFDRMKKNGHEQVTFCYDKNTGLRAIIAIHDTTLGPAMGGCRIKEYGTEEDALQDALLLSQAMTFKNSMAGISYGGAKSVVWLSSPEEKDEALLRSFGRFVETLQGRYFTAQDVGSTHEDMEHIFAETQYMLGSPGMRLLALPSEITSYGVLAGMKVCLQEVFGSESLKGRVVAIQGVGKIGYYLSRCVSKEGAELIITDVDAMKTKEVAEAFQARVVAPDEIYGVRCDVFSPCALGGVLNEKTVGQLQCKIVAGGANNQLASEAVGDLLAGKGILYAPDFAINAGGAINGVALIEDLEGRPYPRAQAMEKTAFLSRSAMQQILAASRKRKIPTHRVADILARERIEKIARIPRLNARPKK